MDIPGSDGCILAGVVLSWVSKRSGLAASTPHFQVRNWCLKTRREALVFVHKVGMSDFSSWVLRQACYKGGDDT